MFTKGFNYALTMIQKRFPYKHRLFSLNYKNVPKNLQESLELFCETKLNEYNKLLDSFTYNTADTISIAKYKKLKPIVDILTDIDLLKNDMDELHSLFKDSEDETEMQDVIAKETLERNTMKENLYNKLISLLTSNEDLDNISDVSVEILCGAGGQESMLFVEELSGVYLKYMARQQWVVENECPNPNDLGGFRSFKFLVRGQNVYSKLKYESGIHRVQRIPLTSPMGKIHTSTVAVVVLPFVENLDLDVPESHLKWESFKSSGPGGQHVNTTDSAVRVTHIPSGLAVVCQGDRLQQKNRQDALNQLLNMLNEKEFEEKLQRINSKKRIMIGSRARSDKIRTYNYQQGRITDHRIHRSWSNLGQIIDEGRFEEITSSLLEADLLELLEIVLNNNEDE